MFTDARRVMATGAVFAALGVVLGAFGAHALRARLAEDLFAIYQTGVQYHLVHALALLATGLALQARTESRAIRCAAWAFCLGIIVFSGSLYLLALTGDRHWGAVTPFGGVAYIGGWLILAYGVSRPVR